MTGVIYSTVRETAIDRRDNGQKLSITGVLKILGLSKSGYYDFAEGSHPLHNYIKRI